MNRPTAYRRIPEGIGFSLPPTVAWAAEHDGRQLASFMAAVAFEASDNWPGCRILSFRDDLHAGRLVLRWRDPDPRRLTLDTFARQLVEALEAQADAYRAEGLTISAGDACWLAEHLRAGSLRIEAQGLEVTE